MVEPLHFRRADTGEEVDAEVAGAEPWEFPAGEYLTARQLELADGTRLRQHRVAPGADRFTALDRLDNEIMAGRLVHRVSEWGGYPAEVSYFYGDPVDLLPAADPYALLKPYRGDPLHRRVTRLLGGQEDAVVLSLLTGLCWLASAGIAHRAISPDTVYWDGRDVLITDFSRCAVFGAPRSPVAGSPGWIPFEQRQMGSYGTVGAGDDIWAAGRLIYYIKNQGEELHTRDQLVRSGLDVLLHDVWDAPEGRPTAERLITRFGGHSTAPHAGGTRLRDGQRRFWSARASKHPYAPVPPDVQALLDAQGGGASPGRAVYAEPAAPPAAPSGPGAPNGTAPYGTAPNPDGYGPAPAAPARGRHRPRFRRGDR